MDNNRINSASEELAWKASSSLAKGLCWLGLQDAARKHQKASQRPGAWAGAVIASDGNTVTNSVTQERWENNRHKIQWLESRIYVSDKFTPVTFEDVSPQADYAPKEKMQNNGKFCKDHCVCELDIYQSESIS